MKTPATVSWLPTNEDFEYGSLVEVVGRANRAIAHFQGVLLAVPNPDVLISPLTTHEAFLSSRIEGTQVTFGEVLQFEAGKDPRQESRIPDIREILNYRKALRSAEAELKQKPFNLNLIRKLHGLMLSGVRGDRMRPGEFRKEQNWIGQRGTTIEQADFIPPSPLELMDQLTAWERFYHASGYDPLIQLAIVHAQFEFIHPFLDGNGRMGRLIIPLFLFEKAILQRPVFYMSEWLEEHHDQYYASLRQLTNNKDSWLSWIRFFLEAVAGQAGRNSTKAGEIHNLYKRYKDQLLGEKPSKYSVRLLDQIFQFPVFATSILRFGPHPPSRPTLRRLLRTAEDHKIIKTIDEGAGRIPTLYACQELVNLCEGKKVF